jgi:hypothetical protein
MKKLWVAAVTTAMFLGAQAYGEVKSVNVVGVMGLEITGHPDNHTYTLLAAPMTKLPVARGLIAGNTADTITVESSSWAANRFAVGGDAADEPGDSTYYVEITSGAFEGRHFYIASNDSDTLTLAAEMDDVSPGDLAGVGYKIIPANRVRDIFGEPGGGAVLTGASGPASADTISLMFPSGWSDPIFYQVGGFPIGNRENWVQSAGIANDLVIDRDIGVLVLRRAGGESVQLSLTGEVSANAQATVVTPGFLLIGGMSAAGTAIGETTLDEVLEGGSGPAVADNLYKWMGATGWSDPVFFQVGGFPIANRDKWIQGGVDVSATFMIEPGTAYLVRRRGDESGVWERKSPLQ